MVGEVGRDPSVLMAVELRAGKNVRIGNNVIRGWLAVGNWSLFGSRSSCLRRRRSEAIDGLGVMGTSVWALALVRKPVVPTQRVRIKPSLDGRGDKPN